MIDTSIKACLTWNGKNSRDLGIYISQVPNLSRPQRKMRVVDVDGRNGSLVFPQKAWNNVTRSYAIFTGEQTWDAERYYDALVEWLSADGYQRLEDDFEPDVYRLAYFAGSVDIVNFFGESGTATLNFNCKPQKFLKSGEKAVSFSSGGGTLRNPTGFEAKPLIVVKGSGSGTVTIGGVSVSISSIGTSVTLDCENQDAYNGSTNRNNTITASTFPTLKPGNNTIALTGGTTSVTIIPRFWRL
jgi:phage-related protein